MLALPPQPMHVWAMKSRSRPTRTSSSSLAGGSMASNVWALSLLLVLYIPCVCDGFVVAPPPASYSTIRTISTTTVASSMRQSEGIGQRAPHVAPPAQGRSTARQLQSIRAPLQKIFTKGYSMQSQSSLSSASSKVEMSASTGDSARASEGLLLWAEERFPGCSPAVSEVSSLRSS